MLPNRIEFTAAGNASFSTSFTHRQEVAGLKLPYRITTSKGGTVTDNSILHEIAVNPESSRAHLQKR